MAKAINGTIVNNLGRNANGTLRGQIFRLVGRSGAVKFQTAPRIPKNLKLNKVTTVNGEEVSKFDTVTVNNHLRALATLGFIEAVGKENRPGKGRPSTVFNLTASGALALRK